MKKLMLILLMCGVLGLGGLAKGGDTLTSELQKVFSVIVIDASATSASTWGQLKVLACQAIDSLQPGDRLEVLSARPGKPLLHISSLIESPTLSRRESFHKCVGDIKQTFFLFKADVAKAVEVAFNNLNKQSRSYRCCLLILSDGKLDDNQIRQIRRLATAYRSRNWPFCFTATKGANRHLFIAGSHDELEVALTHQVNLAEWLEKVRTAAIAKPAEEVQKPLKPTEAQPKAAKETSNGRLAKTKPVKGPVLSPGKATGRLPHIKGPNDISGARPDVDNSRAGWYIPAYPIIDDTKPPPLPDELQQSKEPKIPDKPKTKAKSIFSVLRNKWPLALATGGILAGVILYLLVTALVKPAASTSVLERESDTGAETRYMLMAESNGETYDLGEENNINNLIFGSDANSAIPLIGDAIEPEEFKLIRNRNGFKIQNFSKTPLNVNGLELKYRQKTELVFPATVHSEKKFRITFLLEQAEEPVLSATGGQENEIQ